MLYSQPPSRPYKMTGFLPERPQYELACCCAPSCRKIATIAVSETILFRVMPLQNDRSPSHYKMSCFLLLPTHYSPTMPPQSERSSSHIPHHSKSCPYKMRGFLTNTYNRGWHCCSIFLSFSQAYNLRLWSVQNSSGFWHPSMVPSKKKADTHTHRTTKFQVGFLMPFGFTTKWVSWICYIQTVLYVSKCLRPFKANFLSTKWVLYNGWKQHPKTIPIKKK